MKRHCDISIKDYIIEFENLNHLMENQNMKLPDKILAFKILEGATISENQRLMCLTLANDQTFKSIKTGLKRTFSDQTNTSKDVTNQFEDLNINIKLRRKVNPKDKKGKITR